MTTMLDKCAVAGDITQGIDRRGVWTAAITVIGGTSNTAVKLVSCDTVDGEYTDFKTLISAADAATDQYKGFVVDLHGAKKYIKVTGAVMATAVFGDCDHDVKDIVITEGEVPSGADLENNKAATINASTYTEPVEVTPSEGKDGMKKATITLSNIPSGGVSTLYAWGKEFEYEGETDIDSPYFYSTSATPTAGDKLLVSEGESGSPSIFNYEKYRVKALNDGVLTVEEKVDDTWSDYEFDGSAYEGVRDSDNDITL